MIIRKAEAEDIRALVRVINLAYRVEDFFINGDRTNETEINNLMRKPNACFLIIEDEINNNLAGAVYIEIRNNRGYYGLLSVDPKYQKKGFAGRLVNEAEEYCRKKDCTDMDIDVVNLREELLPFYQHLGYHLTGETADFKDTIKLKKEAYFLFMTKKL